MVYDYLYMRAWAEVIDYAPDELEEYLARARAEKAPENALFPMRIPGGWQTTEILAPDLLAVLDAKVAKLKADTRILR